MFVAYVSEYYTYFWQQKNAATVGGEGGVCISLSKKGSTNSVEMYFVYYKSNIYIYIYYSSIYIIHQKYFNRDIPITQTREEHCSFEYIFWINRFYFIGNFIIASVTALLFRSLRVYYVYKSIYVYRCI